MNKFRRNERKRFRRREKEKKVEIASGDREKGIKREKKDDEKIKRK